MFPKYVLLSICAFIRVQFGRLGKFHSVHPSGVHTHFPKTSYDQRIFSKKSWKSSLFKSMPVFQLDNLFSFSPSFSYLPSFSLFALFFLTCSFFFCSLFFYHDFCLFYYIFFWAMFLNEELYTVPEFQTSLTVMI